MKKSLSDLGEFGLIGRIKKEFLTRTQRVKVGIGDDAAVLAPPAKGKKQLISTDILVERVHFDLSYTPPRLLGKKSLSVNVSDIAAMGGKPKFATLSLAIDHNKTTFKFIQDFLRGFKEVATEHGVSLIGGDLSASRSGLVVSVTIMGEGKQPVLRSGAKKGDSIFVTGTLGDSALGLKMLKQEGLSKLRGRKKWLAMRHLDPSPRVNIGNSIARHATAMIDLSDGLASDLMHICEQSKVGAVVDSDTLPRSDAYRSAAGGDRTYAIGGGEDYELLFTASPKDEKKVISIGKKHKIPVTKIGEIIKGEPGISFEGSGMVTGQGYRHF